MSAETSFRSRFAPARSLLAVPLRFAWVTLLCLSLSRLLLLLWQHDRVTAWSDVPHVLLGGLRMDTVAISYLLAPAVLVLLAAGGTHRLGGWVANGVRAYLTIALTGFLYLEIATPPFVQEFDSRPNRLFVEYLVHPKEVIGMLMGGYQLELVLTGALTATAAVAAWRIFRSPSAKPVGVLQRGLLAILLVPLLFLGARSSLQHRPANPSSVAFSGDHLLNDLCVSSLYSVAYAVSQMSNEADAAAIYGQMPRAEILAEVRGAMSAQGLQSFPSDAIPTLHHQAASATPEQPLNLVIILEESLGAQFVGALGGKPVTQYLNRLADQGWWFEDLYATGTRSARGIEAVVTGFPPSPARSTVKLGLSQHGFFSLADLLSRHGYHTQFLYGGESHFDNMKSFLTGNGFEEVIDQDDFEDPIFAGSWGVCDEDMFAMLHRQLSQPRRKPLFSFAFTVSNHSPWEYPSGKFEPYEGEPPATRHNSVRYADYALGQFFEQAQASDYWKNTIFLVVADHDSRVYGASLVPIEHFHIPALILGAGVPVRRDARVASQMDLAPTLLSLLGISADHPMIGWDLTRVPLDHPGRAIMQYGSNQAYRVGSQVVVHQPHLPAEFFEWDGHALQPSTADPAFGRTALAHALLPTLLYQEQSYQLPPYVEQ